jgi:hypothetical protein
MFSQPPKFLQKTVAGFCTNLCQHFIDIFWRRGEQKNAQKLQKKKKMVSYGDRGDHFRGLIAKLCLHVFHGNLFISLFNDTANISGFISASGWMINV